VKGISLIKDLAQTVDKSIVYEGQIPASTGPVTLPDIGAGTFDISTITTFMLYTDTAITLNWNSADLTLSADSVFIAFNCSTTTAPTVTNSQSSAANILMIVGGS